MSSLRVAHQTFHCSKGSGLTRFPERDLNRSMFIFLGKRTLKQPISPRQLLLLPCLHSVQGLVLGQNSEVKQDEGCDLWGNTVSLEPGNPAPKSLTKALLSQPYCQWSFSYQCSLIFHLVPSQHGIRVGILCKGYKVPWSSRNPQGCDHNSSGLIPAQPRILETGLTILSKTEDFIFSNKNPSTSVTMTASVFLLPVKEDFTVHEKIG